MNSDYKANAKLNTRPMSKLIVGLLANASISLAPYLQFKRELLE
jgi:hypothetical protein